MNATTAISRRLAWAVLVSALLLLPPRGQAHCDGMDGPVVKAAQAALESGNVNHALIWVQKNDEPEIRRAFERTLAVRKLSSDGKALADQYFFETLVRIHRAGEGEPYTGLKPAGRDLGPAIPAADAALARGSAEGVVELLTHAVQHAVVGQFEAARSKREFSADNVTAGRDYVAAYVTFLHAVERMHQATQPRAGHESH
jgi:hypothetical protein